MPQTAQRYLAHTETGISIRALARDAGCHASTVLRQIRRFEVRREDPLVDGALRRLGQHVSRFDETGSPMQERPITPMKNEELEKQTLSEAALKRDGRRVLRRLCEASTLLLIAPTMDRAVIVREIDEREPTRLGIVDKMAAEAMALKGWIQCIGSGKVTRYQITKAGREALLHLLSDIDDEDAGDTGIETFQSGFDESSLQAGKSVKKRKRYGVSETPLTSLARRKDRNGMPFLPDELVRVGERLREDFELAQLGPRVNQNWDRFLTGGVRNDTISSGAEDPASAARQRVVGVLRDLGPGLGDVVLHCCCYLEGLERVEKRMGWSARSGKIVLRIALQRLKRHYDKLGSAAEMIG